MVHHDLVPERKIRNVEAMAILCAHGDTVIYPLAEISMEVDGRTITVEAAVSDTLPMSVLLGLGTDTPELAKLLVNSEESEVALAVTTRAGSKKQEQEASLQNRREDTREARPRPLEAAQHENSSVWMEELDDELAK